jgi:hypothetical protein
MQTPSKLFNFKAPAALLEKANATAAQNCQTLSAVLRQYLEVYTASQSPKTLPAVLRQHLEATASAQPTKAA